MAVQILTISDQPDDIRLGKFIALTNSYHFMESMDPPEIERFLSQPRDTIVLWNADNMDDNSEIVKHLSKYVRPSRNITITANNLGKYPYLMKYPFFGHHVQRRFRDPAPIFYARLAAASLQPKSEGLKPYFPPDTKVQCLQIKKSQHKKAAIEALQNTLTNRGIKGRVATLIAQCTDELLLNAMFDAPITNNSTRFRHRYSRAMEFDMTAQERIYMEMAVCDQYMGICIADSFGSLNRITVFNALRSYFAKEAKMGDALSAPASGFGLQGILQAGVNLKIFCVAKKRTEAMIFFPIEGSFKEFRTSFRFFSLVVGENK